MDITKENIYKYWSFLKSIYDILQHTNQVSLTKLCDENDIPALAIDVLKKGGIIHSDGGRGVHARWTWISKKPDNQMALETIKRLNSKGDLNHSFYSDDEMDCQLEFDDTVLKQIVIDAYGKLKLLHGYKSVFDEVIDAYEKRFGKEPCYNTTVSIITRAMKLRFITQKSPNKPYRINIARPQDPIINRAEDPSPAKNTQIRQMTPKESEQAEIDLAIRLLKAKGYKVFKVELKEM